MNERRGFIGKIGGLGGMAAAAAVLPLTAHSKQERQPVAQVSMESHLSLLKRITAIEKQLNGKATSETFALKPEHRQKLDDAPLFDFDGQLIPSCPQTVTTLNLDGSVTIDDINGHSVVIPTVSVENVYVENDCIGGKILTAVMSDGMMFQCDISGTYFKDNYEQDFLCMKTAIEEIQQKLSKDSCTTKHRT